MFLRKLLIASSSLVLAACATIGEDFVEPSAPTFTAEELQTVSALDPLTEEPAHDWWIRLGDPTLSGFVERALHNNRELRMAVANVNAARAQARLTDTLDRPLGEVTAQYAYADQPGIEEFDTAAQSQFSIGAGVTWELDFVGRLQRLEEAAIAEFDEAVWLSRDARVLVIAEVADAYIDLRTAETGLDIARKNKALQERTLEITRIRLEEGIGERLDVSRAEAQLLTTDALIPPLEADRIAALNRLATLTGQHVTEVGAQVQAASLDTKALSAQIAIGDVEGLLRRRADIRAAVSRLAAATARVGVAEAEYFPRISLGGFLGLAAPSLGALGSGESVGFSLGPSISWGGFDSARVEAGIDIREAELEGDFARYEQSVLVALDETQTAIARYANGLTQVSRLEAAEERSREAVDLASVRFEEGVGEFIEVLDAESRLLAAQRETLSARRALYVSLVDVNRTLGAGWQVDNSAVARLD